MEKNYKLTVPDIKEKIRIDKYIPMFIQNISRNKVQKVINMGNVTVNGDCVKSNYILKPYDEIDIDLPVPDKQEVLPEDIPLDIVYEDNYLMIINKPAGMVVHPAYKNYSGTLVNAVMYYAQKRNDSLSDLNGFERAGIVHRLDKDTSGILVIAKDEVTHRKLAELFYNHNIEREYQALIWGSPKKKTGRIENKITRDLKDRKKMTVSEDEERGKLAITDYEILEEYDILSLVKLNLKTGRTHQIRVHLSSIGHPVFGDDTYGGRKPHCIELNGIVRARINNMLRNMKRQALHAKVLGFTHPITKETMRFESKLPEDIISLIEYLKPNERNQN